MKSKFIGMIEAAKELRLSRTRIHQLCLAGRIKGATIKELGAYRVWQIPTPITLLPRK